MVAGARNPLYRTSRVLPIIASIWISTTAWKLSNLTYGFLPLLFLAALGLVGIFGGRKQFRIAERSFLSLNALAVQPVLHH